MPTCIAGENKTHVLLLSAEVEVSLTVQKSGCLQEPSE